MRVRADGRTARERVQRRSFAVLGAAFLGTMSLLVGACGGGSTGEAGASGSFVLLKTEPSNNGRVFLNQTLRFFFSNPVDLDSANFNSVSFTAKDDSGNVLAEQVLGNFAYGRNVDDEVDSTILEFKPKLPTNDDYTNGGFKPGRIYVIDFIGGTNRVSPSLRDSQGRSISDSTPIQRVTVRTPSGTSPNDLFLDTRVGGPRVSKIEISPKIGNRVSLNKLGDLPLSIVLTFNQPIDPASQNLPKDQDQNPVNAKKRNKGKLYLEYDDPELGDRVWVRSQVTLLANEESGARVVLHPDGVLPNNATIRIIALPEFRDIAGETNVKDASYRSEVGSFQTEEALDSQFDAVVIDFGRSGILDVAANYRDPVALLEKGVLKASFDFEGIDSPFDFGPDKNVILNTQYTVVQPKNGRSLPVTGGVFSFRNVDVPEGVVVSGVGPNPLVFLATGKVTIRGTLSANGGDGEGILAINAANIPGKGGSSNAGGGAGGRSSTAQKDSTANGETGFGPGNKLPQGGAGGAIACGPVQTGYGGSGGGGGSFVTQGDSGFYSFSSDSVVLGNGGKGKGSQGDVTGGKPGQKVFTDEDPNNDFYGRQVDSKGLVHIGELSALRGGNGGGGGGDRTSSSSCFAGISSFFNDEKGGGGGAGGGVLVIKALDKITIGPKGRVSADGGNGGGGEPAASCGEAGGGGGGSGGMVVLMSATGIDIWSHKDQWKAPFFDSDFAITADGGVGLSNPSRTTKYQSSNPGASNRGGFGGMGVVQLMVPPGASDADGTGDIQDEFIRVLDKVGKPFTGAAKRDWIYSGDIRPRPHVMPNPFSRYSQFRSVWIATGATERVQVKSTTPRPRAILAPATPGPDFFFSGTETSGVRAGYVKTDLTTGKIAPSLVTLTGNVTRGIVRSGSAGTSTFRGRNVHSLDFVQAYFPADGSLSNHRAFLYGSGNTKIGEFRIVGHDSNTLYLDMDEGSLPGGIASVSVAKKFFSVYTDNTAGLGAAVGGKGGLFPQTTFKLGFAFHKDPSDPKLSSSGGKTIDNNRFPQQVGTFTWDLESAAARAALRGLHMPFMKVMVRFNLNFNPEDPDGAAGPNPVNPTKTKRPELRMLLTPYRF